MNCPKNFSEDFLSNESDLLRTLLWSRGIKTEKEAEIFLNPAYERDLHDPFLMKGMREAVKRINEALQNKEKIVVYGDYDCDGTSAAAILADFFRQIDYKNFDVYIPAREEGYGLTKDALLKISQGGANLIITVDCGVANYNEVEFARGLGLDVVVTDHHLPPPILPRFILFNPKQPGCIYPEKMLCGAAIAFKLVLAMGRLETGQEKWLLDLVALATLADQVPLLGENRALAYYGLKVLNKTKRLGLKEIIKLARIREIKEDDVLFSIVPRLNSVSRLISSALLFEILSTDDLLRARELAQKIEMTNKERKGLVASISKEIKNIFTKKPLRDVIVIGNPDWPLGVVGLAAAFGANEYERPCFVWTRVGDAIKGSCRLPDSENISLVELMQKLPEQSLASFGGHEAAGGFAATLDQIHYLEERLVDTLIAMKQNSGNNLDKTAENKEDLLRASLADINSKNFKIISRLAPFGEANPRPVFLFDNLKVTNTKKFGQNNAHLSIACTDDINETTAVCFYEKRTEFPEPISFKASIEQDYFRNSLRLRIDSFV